MTYDEQHAALVNDLKGKLEREDWHGVSDAANDLRVLEAENASYEHLRRTAPVPGHSRCSAYHKRGSVWCRCIFSVGHTGFCMF